MHIDTADVARVFRFTVRHAHSVLGALGCRPIHRSGKGGVRFVWSGRDVLGALTCAALVRRGVSVPEAEAVGRVIVTLPSDEQLEAVLDSGRSWVMCIGDSPMPELLFIENVRRVARERAETLTAHGLSLTALDVAPLYAALRDTLTAQKQVPDVATE